MAKQIKRADIIELNPFENLEKSAKNAKKSIDLLETSLKKVKTAAKTIENKVGKTKPKDTKSIKEFNALTKQANQTSKVKLKIDKQLLFQQQHLKKLQLDQNKAIKTEINLRKSEVGSLNQVRAQNAKLALEKGKVNLKTKAGAQRVKEINRQLDRNNKILQKNSSALGKQKMNIGNYGSAVGKLKGMLAGLGLAFGAFSLIKGSFNVIKDFQQSQADLASVLGKNVNEMKRLTDQAKLLGSTTRFTASEVSDLQKELAKLGFGESDIENMTQATLSLAAATGTDLARAAEVAGGIINGFGLDSKDTGMVVDTMAKSFSNSALDMEKFAETMKTAAPIAKVTGVGLNEATAAAGILANNMISGSKAGTDLKKIFSELAKDGKPLKESLEDVAAQLAGAETKSEKLAIATDLVGERAKGALLILAEQRGGLEELEVAYDNADGAAKDMADTQLDTLGGSIDLLKSAWEGLILSMDEAGGIGEKLKKGIKAIADNLPTIVSWVWKAIKAFLAYKAALIAIKVLNSPFITGLKDTVKGLKNMKVSAKGAASGIKAMGKALKGVGFAVAIMLALEVAAALWDIFTNAKRVQDAIARMERAEEGASKRAQERIDNRSKTLKEALSTEERALALAIAAAKTEKERTKLNQEFLKVKVKLIESNERQIRSDIDAVTKTQKAEKDALKEQEDILNKLYGKNARENQTVTKGGNTAKFDAAGRERLKVLGILNDKNQIIIGSFDKLIKKQDLLAGSISGADIKLKQYNAELQQAAEDTKDAESESDVFQKTLVTVKDNADGAAAGIKEINTEFGNQINLLEVLQEQMDSYLNAVETLAEIEIDNDIREKDEQIEGEKTDLGFIAESGKTADTTKLEKLFEDRKQLEIKKIEETSRKEIELINQKHVQKFVLMNEDLDNQRAKLIEAAEGDAKAIAKIEANYKTEKDKVKLLQLDDQAVLDAEILVSKRTAEIALIDLEKQTAKEINEIKNDLNEKTIQGIKDQEAADKEAKDKAIENEKEAAEKRKEIIKGLSDYAIKQTDDRIKALDKEIAAHEKQADFLREAAAQGNISAKESLAEENRLIAEAEVEKAALEKRKQNILFATAILQGYNANLAAGLSSTESFGKAITDATLLSQFLGTISGFYDGTEDTGNAGFASDQNGPITGYTHANERVLTAKDNRKIGDYSNSEVVHIMEKHRLGKAVDGAQVSAGWGNEILVDQLMTVGEKLDKVNNTIKNKPETNIELGAITQTAFNIVEKRKQGNRTTQKTFLVKTR